MKVPHITIEQATALHHNPIRTSSEEEIIQSMTVVNELIDKANAEQAPKLEAEDEAFLGRVNQTVAAFVADSFKQAQPEKKEVTLGDLMQHMAEPVDKHAELRAEYERQRNAVPCELKFYLWEFSHPSTAGWLPIKRDLGIFYAYNEYRYTDLSCMVAKEGEPAVRMLRSEAKELQRSLGNTVEWKTPLNLIGAKSGYGFCQRGTYTYKPKATIKLDGRRVTPKQAAAEWEAKKETHELWFKFYSFGNWDTVIGYPKDMVTYFRESNSEYKLRPKELKQVSWSDMPQFVKVQRIDTKTSYTFLSFDEDDDMACLLKNDGLPDYANKTSLELAPASEQPWIAVQDTQTGELIKHDLEAAGIVVEFDFARAKYRIAGIAKGWELK